MKRLLFLTLLLLPAVALAQPAPQPTPCPCHLALPDADPVLRDALYHVVINGRVPLLENLLNRKVAKTVLQYRNDALAGKITAPTDTLESRLKASGVNPQKICNAIMYYNMFAAIYNSTFLKPGQAPLPIMPLPAYCLAPVPPVPPVPPAKAPTRAIKRDATANWLSTKFILDGCAGSNGGCNGDDNTTVLAAAKNMGIPLEADYGPYTARNQGCHSISGSGVMLYTASDWLYVDPSTTGVGSTDLIKAAIMKYGGVGCAVAADGNFQNYSGGVFQDDGNTSIDHDVYIVGWDDSKGAWLMINSWGSGWGVSPITGQAVGGPKHILKTGLTLKPANIRSNLHAQSRAMHAQGIADLLAIIKKGLPPSYSGLAFQSPIADQGQCGTCWDFSGVRVVSTAQILAGYLPKSAWVGGGCMWIAYGANLIGTEPVVAIAGPPKPYVAPPGPGPTPPLPNPSHRATLLRGLGEQIYAKDPVTGEKLLKDGEDAVGKEAKRLGIPSNAN